VSLLYSEPLPKPDGQPLTTSHPNFFLPDLGPLSRQGADCTFGRLVLHLLFGAGFFHWDSVSPPLPSSKFFYGCSSSVRGFRLIDSRGYAFPFPSFSFPPTSLCKSRLPWFVLDSVLYPLFPPPDTLYLDLFFFPFKRPT